MLVPAMNPKEVTAEVLRDLSKLKNTQARLLEEYHRERKRLKIDKTRMYTKVYPIKTKAKNTWLIFIHKPPALERYHRYDYVACCPIVYYYGKEGFTALRYIEEADMLEVFWGHLFNRYNERMQLNLKTPLETMIHFFSNNGYFEHLKTTDGNRVKTVGVCAEGLVFGEVMHEEKWQVNKTFITKEMAYKNQAKLQEKILKLLELDIVCRQAKRDAKEDEIFGQQNVLKAIRA